MRYKIKWKNIIITAAAAIVIAAIVLAYECSQLDWNSESTRIISDSFFVSGILILFAAVISGVANAGGFYIFGFAGVKLKKIFSRSKGPNVKYYDYCAEQKAKGKQSLIHLFIVGAACMVIAVIALLIVGF